MKTINTIAGNVYCVTSKNGGTVTDATGTLSEPIEAGKQVHVTAPSDMLLIDDDEAILRPANFKRARLALRMLGAGDKNNLPAGYTKLDFVESTGTQYIRLRDLIITDTDSVAVNFAVVSYITKAANGIFSAYKYSSGETLRAFMSESSGRVKMGTAWAEGRATGLPISFGTENTLTMSSAGTVFNGEQTGSANTQPFAWSNYVLFTQYVNNTYWNAAIKIKRFAVSGKCNLTPALTPDGIPCMYDTVTGVPLRNSGTGQFVAGVASTAQLRSLLSSLSHNARSAETLTLSLPAEANTPEVAAAMEQCQAQTGMTLTVYEYRPAAVTTYSLRRVRNMVWCRVAEDADGNYVSFNGERFNIERCAAIYGPLGSDPTAYGYEPFDSLEDAAAWFGLTPYEYPEDETF